MEAHFCEWIPEYDIRYHNFNFNAHVINIMKRIHFPVSWHMVIMPFFSTAYSDLFYYYINKVLPLFFSFALSISVIFRLWYEILDWIDVKWIILFGHIIESENLKSSITTQKVWCILKKEINQPTIKYEYKI